MELPYTFAGTSICSCSMPPWQGLPGAQIEVYKRCIVLIELVCLEVQLTFVMYSYKQILKIIHASKNGINVIEVFSSISKVF